MLVFEGLLSYFSVLFVFFRKYILLIGQNNCPQKSVKPEFYIERGQLSQTSALSEKYWVRLRVKIVLFYESF